MGAALALAKSQYNVAYDILKELREQRKLAKEFEDMYEDDGSDDKNINEFEKDLLNLSLGKIPEDIKQDGDVTIKIPKNYIVNYQSLITMSEEDLMLMRLKFQLWNTCAKKMAVLFPDTVNLGKVNSVIERLRKENLPMIKEIIQKERKLLIIFYEDWEEEPDVNLDIIAEFVDQVYYNRLSFLRKSEEFKKKLVGNVFQNELPELHEYLTKMGYNPTIEDYRIVLHCDW